MNCYKGTVLCLAVLAATGCLAGRQNGVSTPTDASAPDAGASMPAASQTSSTHATPGSVGPAASPAPTPMATPTPSPTVPPIVTGMLSTHANDASGAGTPGSYTYFDAWPASAAQRTSEDYTIKITVDPGPTSDVYWSNMFSLGTFSGYVGMQSTNLTHDTSQGKLFLLSVWNATDAKAGSDGSWCGTFDEGGAGYTCRYLYAWQVNHTYRFHLAAQGAGWFQVTVNDMDGTDTFVIGSVLVDPSLSTVNPGLWSEFTEYYEWSSPGITCGAVPGSTAMFGVSATINGAQVSPGVQSLKPSSACVPYTAVTAGNTPGASIHRNAIGNSVRNQVTYNGQCLDLTTAPAADAGALLNTCQTQAALQDSQAWVFANDGSLRVKGNFCLTASGADAGASVNLQPCPTGSANLAQEWAFANGWLATAQKAGFCLAPDGTGQLVLAACDAAAAQWRLPVVP